MDKTCSDLVRACRVGNIVVVKFLIARKVNIHVNTELALIAACESNNREIVVLLLENGADLHVRGEICLQIACRTRNLELIYTLICYGARVSVLTTEFLDAVRLESDESILDHVLDRIDVCSIVLGNKVKHNKAEMRG